MHGLLIEEVSTLTKWHDADGSDDWYTPPCDQPVCALPACRSVVEGLLECANWAPTHGRTEPWRFVVLGRAAQEQLMDLSLQVGLWLPDAGTPLLRQPHLQAALCGC